MSLRNKITASIVFATIVFFMAFLVLAFFLDLHFYSFDEVARSHSPDGKIDALLVERGVGVGGANHYWIYLVRSGDTVNRYTQYFSFFPWQSAKTVGDVYDARKVSEYGLDLRWRGNTVLEVSCNAAGSHKLTKAITVEGQTVHVIFRLNN